MISSFYSSLQEVAKKRYCAKLRNLGLVVDGYEPTPYVEDGDTQYVPGAAHY